MLTHSKKQIEDYISQTLSLAYPDVSEWPVVRLEIPADKKHGHFSCNVAMQSAKVFRKAPINIAEEFLTVLNDNLSQTEAVDLIDKIEVKGPGFINFFLKQQALLNVVEQIYTLKEKYGHINRGLGQKVCIEFVSANPTGPLSIAHGRQAAVGDALGNILKFIGFEVTKEYYVNDGGNQIRILGKSLKLRMKELLGEQVDFPDDYYQGDYIKSLAEALVSTEKPKLIIEELKKLSPDSDNFDIKWVSDWSDETFEAFAKNHLMEEIRKDLADFHVYFDQESFESEVATPDKIEGMLSYLGEKGFMYDKDGALWFKSTDFEDDKDRVLQKSDGSYTYLTPDIVYHKNKFDRGFDQAIDILGPDHHGYIARIKASVEAMGRNRDDLAVLIVQLATIYRDGEAISMSTRKGQYVSLREVIDEVGADVARYFFLMRHIKAHLDFDLELAKKESSENPVYYIQYAYARINSINKKAEDSGIQAVQTQFALLNSNEELDLVKQLGGFSDALLYCHDQLDPYPLVNYLFELATCFHKFYDRHRVVQEDIELASQRLGLVNATHIVLGNGLTLLGISRPDSM